MMDPLPSLVLTALWEAYECFFWPFELPLDEHVWDAIFCDRAGDICRGLIHNGKPGLPIKALPGILACCLIAAGLDAILEKTKWRQNLRSFLNQLDKILDKLRALLVRMFPRLARTK
jgi:hypothetical protein